MFGRLLYYLAKKYASVHTNMLHYLDWSFRQNPPSHYKHEIDLYNWIYNPSRVEFVESGSLTRLYINENDSILDLCCGDGSYSYLFYSDITKKVDAIDYDINAIKYAKKTYSKSNINYICSDLLKFEAKNNSYNMVVWSAGIAYFSKEKRKLIFNMIYESLVKNGTCFIYTPLEPEDSSAGLGQKEMIHHIINKKDFEDEFSDMFDIDYERKTVHKIRTNLYYVLKKKEFVGSNIDK